MVTLTFPAAGVHDYDEALRYVQNFMHDHGHLVRRKGEYVAVPELHPNGHRWHWHVLVSKRFTKAELKALREGWTKYLERKGLTPSGGAHYVRVNLKEFKSPVHASAYAVKYIGKSFGRLDNMKYRKRYLASKGIKIETIEGKANDLAEVLEFAKYIDGAYVYESSDNSEWQGPPLVWVNW